MGSAPGEPQELTETLVHLHVMHTPPYYPPPLSHTHTLRWGHRLEMREMRTERCVAEADASNSAGSRACSNEKAARMAAAGPWSEDEAMSIN